MQKSDNSLCGTKFSEWITRDLYGSNLPCTPYRERVSTRHKRLRFATRNTCTSQQSSRTAASATAAAAATAGTTAAPTTATTDALLTFLHCQISRCPPLQSAAAVSDLAISASPFSELFEMLSFIFSSFL